MEAEVTLCKCSRKCGEKFETEELLIRERGFYLDLRCPKEENEFLSRLLVRKDKKTATVNQAKSTTRDRKYTREYYIRNTAKEKINVCKDIFLKC